MKRADRLPLYFTRRSVQVNAWIGVSVEDKSHGLPRINDLSNITAAVRFLSIEPLIEDIGTIDLTNIDWVIVGGESGAKLLIYPKNLLHNVEQIFDFFQNSDRKKIPKNPKKNQFIPLTY